MGSRNLQAISDQEEPSKLLRKSSSKGEIRQLPYVGMTLFICAAVQENRLLNFGGGLSGLCIFLESFQGAVFNLLHFLEFT